MSAHSPAYERAMARRAIFGKDADNPEHDLYGSFTPEEAEAVLDETQRLNAQPSTRPARRTAAPDAVARWTAAIDNKVKAGLSRAHAVRAVVRENPELHAEYLESFNAARKPAPTSAPITPGSAERQWKEAIAAKVACGVSHGQAIVALEREQPELRRQFLKEYNASHGRLVPA